MIWPSHYIHINTSGKETTQKKQLKHTKWDKTGFVPPQAHTSPSSPTFRLKPSWKNASFQSLTLRSRRQNLLFCILTLNNGAGVWVSPVPKGYRSKRQLLMERRSMAFSRGQRERQLYLLVQSTKTSTALNKPTPRRDKEQDIATWIPNPYYSTNSATQTGSSSYDPRIRCWKKQGKRVTATVDSLGITLMLSVI